jgi:hypothetical protein
MRQSVSSVIFQRAVEKDAGKTTEEEQGMDFRKERASS